MKDFLLFERYVNIIISKDSSDNNNSLVVPVLLTFFRHLVRLTSLRFGYAPFLSLPSSTLTPPSLPPPFVLLSGLNVKGTGRD